MANDEHVALLKKGVDAWHAWHDENPNIRPDLSGEDLQYRDLRYVNFKNTSLIDTDMTEALLHHANFIGAECSRGTDLSEAQLSDLQSSLREGVVRLSERAPGDAAGCANNLEVQRGRVKARPNSANPPSRFSQRLGLRYG
jgi:hypothetical protein